MIDSANQLASPACAPTSPAEALRVVERRDIDPRRVNAIKHGCRGSLLPVGCSYITRTLNTLKRSLACEVVAVRGELTWADVELIQVIIDAERHAMLCARWLRLESATMTPDQRLKFSREVTRAREQRHRLIRELGIDVDPTRQSPGKILDRHRAAQAIEVQSCD